MSKTAKLDAAAYWANRAAETWELADRYYDEAKMFEGFAEQARREADEDGEAP